MSILLIDRILAKCPLIDGRYLPIPKMYAEQGSLLKALEEAQIFDCTNTSDYWWSNKKNEQWGAKALFNVMPPFENLWIEISNENVPDSPHGPSPSRSGVHIVQSPKLPTQDLNIASRRIHGEDFEFLFSMEEWPKIYVLTFSVFQFYRLKNPAWAKMMNLPIADDHVQLTGIAWIGILPDGRPCTPLVTLPMEIDKTHVHPNAISQLESIQQLRADVVANEIYQILFSIQFLHCKNVNVKSHKPSEKLSKSWNKRNKRHLVSYKTLEIEPMKQVLETEGQIGHNGLKKALHICRGHFATYTPEKGMLGRKLDKSVTVWKPAHIRGSSTEGFALKDYKTGIPQD